MDHAAHYAHYKRIREARKRAYDAREPALSSEDRATIRRNWQQLAAAEVLSEEDKETIRKSIKGHLEVSKKAANIAKRWEELTVEQLKEVFMTTDVPNSGIKHDSGKVPLDLLPFEALQEVAKVLAFGAQKYSAHNWRGGFLYSRLFAGVLRHLFAYGAGERKDPETGLSHLAHAVCGLLFLLTQEVNGTGTDDLYVPRGDV